MGTAFSLLYPSLSLVVVNQVPEGRRGAALGTFTGFFDLGVGLGAPLAGIAAALGGYPAAFWLGVGLRARHAQRRLGAQKRLVWLEGTGANRLASSARRARRLTLTRPPGTA